ncbi:MAG: helix-turn-helix domain-containing protein [Chitinispirillia bacterium]|nr:helix-turn-helix domain-containing protein [Chitinispirillia bacterium]
MDSLGKRIVHYRKKAGLSQKDLAVAIGTSSSVLSYYESNVNDPPTPMLAKIAEVLDITSDKLLGLERFHPPVVYKNRNEYTLLRVHRILNTLGQDRVLEFATGLSEVPKYTERK